MPKRKQSEKPPTKRAKRAKRNEPPTQQSQQTLWAWGYRAEPKPGKKVPMLAGCDNYNEWASAAWKFIAGDCQLGERVLQLWPDAPNMNEDEKSVWEDDNKRATYTLYQTIDVYNPLRNILSFVDSMFNLYQSRHARYWWLELESRYKPVEEKSIEDQEIALEFLRFETEEKQKENRQAEEEKRVIEGEKRVIGDNQRNSIAKLEKEVLLLEEKRRDLERSISRAESRIEEVEGQVQAVEKNLDDLEAKQLTFKGNSRAIEEKYTERLNNLNKYLAQLQRETDKHRGLAHENEVKAKEDIERASQEVKKAEEDAAKKIESVLQESDRMMKAAQHEVARAKAKADADVEWYRTGGEEDIESEKRKTREQLDKIQKECQEQVAEAQKRNEERVQGITRTADERIEKTLATVEKFQKMADFNKANVRSSGAHDHRRGSRRRSMSGRGRGGSFSSFGRNGRAVDHYSPSPTPSRRLSFQPYSSVHSRRPSTLSYSQPVADSVDEVTRRHPWAHVSPPPFSRDEPLLTLRKTSTTNIKEENRNSSQCTNLLDT